MNNDTLLSSVSSLKSNSNDTSQLTKPKTNLTFFKLASPLKCFHNIELVDTIRNRLMSIDLFNFNQPYEAKTFQKVYNKNRSIFLVDQSAFSVMKSIKCQEPKDNNVMIINSARNHPYNRPTNGPQITEKSTTMNDKEETLIDERFSSPVRKSSSNSILAHLKSISPNFKSIFVRPKSHKPIDSSTLLSKTKVKSRNLFQTEPSFQKFELKELRLNSSVDDILKKFATEDDVIRRTIKNMTSPTRLSISSDRSPLLTGLLPSENGDANKSLLQSQMKTTLDFSSKSKWTCMICLSKHPIKLDICSICGSSKSSSYQLQSVQQLTSPTSTASSSSSSSLAGSLLSLQRKQHQTTPISSSTPSSSPSSKLFSSYLISELGLKQKQPLQTVEKVPEEESPRKNPYIKKWTCLQCNYPNDSLKIVCLNCRWVKTSPTKSTSIDITNELPPFKRSKASDNIITIDVKSSEETKDKNNNVYCASCKSPIRKESQPKEKSPPPPPVNEPKPSTTTGFFVKPISNETKWNCDICLVSNLDTSDKCVCCMTSRPSAKPAAATALLKPLKTSKWTCDTCLVQNESDKTVCVCCQAPKLGQAKPTLSTAPTLMLNQTNLLTNLPSTSSIKFGSSLEPGTQIKFGTTTSTGGLKFDTIFKIPEKQTSEENKELEKISFAPKAPTTEPSISFFSQPKTIEKPESEAPKFSFAPSLPKSETTSILTPSTVQPVIGSLLQPQTPAAFSLFQASQTANKVETTPSFSSTTLNLPSTSSFFTPPKTVSPAPTQVSFFGNTPTEATTSSFTAPPTTNIFSLTPTTQQTQFTNPFSNNKSTFFSTSKPSFNGSFPTQETQFKMPCFGVSTSTTQFTQSFPQFDFKSQSPTSSLSFPSLNNQPNKGFQFTPFSSSMTDLSNANKPTQFMPNLNPIINFVENPNAVVFSGNSETGMNTSAEISQRRLRKAARKHR